MLLDDISDTTDASSGEGANDARPARCQPQAGDLLGDVSDSSAEPTRTSCALVHATPTTGGGQCQATLAQGLGTARVTTANARSADVWERKAAMARVREARAHLRFQRLESQQASALVHAYSAQRVVRRRHHLTSFLPKRWLRSRFVAKDPVMRRGLKLVCRGSKRGVGGRHRSVPFQEVLDIAYDTKRRPTDLAAQHDISAQWIRVLQNFVAMAYLHAQNKLLGKLVRLCQRQRPAFCLRRLAWDETGQHVSLTMEGATAEQERSVWNVLVGRMTVILGFADTTLKLDLVLPQLLVTSPSAEHIHNAFRHQQLAPLFAATNLIGQLSDVHIELDETDAANANYRLHAYHQMTKQSLTCHKVCSLHQNQLIEGLLLAVLGLSLLSRLYSLTILLRTAGKFVQLLHTLHAVVAESLVVRDISVHGPPPVAATEYSLELMRYLFSHYRRFQRSVEHSIDDQMSDTDSECDFAAELHRAHVWQEHSRGGGVRQRLGRGVRGLWRFVLDVEEFVSVFNGPWWERGFVHYCSGPSCCKSREHTLERCVRALKRVPFRQVPSTPAANKWTKLGPVVDILMVGFAVHSVFLLAFLKLQVKDEVAAGDMDMQLALDMCFFCCGWRKVPSSPTLLVGSSCTVLFGGTGACA